MELNNDIHTEHEHATTSLKVLLLVFAIVLVGALAYLVWAQNTAPDTADNSTVVTKKTTTTTPSTTSTTPTTTKTDGTDSWKTYTNTDYGFTLTFGDLWGGYRVKNTPYAPNIVTATYSFNMPSSQGASEESTVEYIGYKSVLIVSVYTDTQWEAIENRGVKLGNKNGYVYAYTAAAHDFIEDLDVVRNDVKTVVATFTFTN